MTLSCKLNPATSSVSLVLLLQLDAQVRGGTKMLSSVPSTAATNGTAVDDDDIAFENLYPALIECFAIILCG